MGDKKSNQGEELQVLLVSGEERGHDYTPLLQSNVDGLSYRQNLVCDVMSCTSYKTSTPETKRVEDNVKEFSSNNLHYDVIIGLGSIIEWTIDNYIDHHFTLYFHSRFADYSSISEELSNYISRLDGKRQDHDESYTHIRYDGISFRSDDNILLIEIGDINYYHDNQSGEPCPDEIDQDTEALRGCLDILLKASIENKGLLDKEGE